MVALALSGCGGDEEPAQPSSSTAIVTATSESTETTESGTTSSEDDEGGAGDEQPIESEARVEGRDGALTPRRIGVPPFIAVRLELRSRDDRRYRVRVAGRTLAVVPGDRARITLDGLQPDRSYVLRGLDGLNDVRIVASGEPGG